MINSNVQQEYEIVQLIFLWDWGNGDVNTIKRATFELEMTQNWKFSQLGEWFYIDALEKPQNEKTV